MKIGMILDLEFPPDPRVENEALSLIAAGHQVFLFALSYDKTLKNQDYKGIHIKRYLSNTLVYKLSALVYTIPLYTLWMKKRIHHFLVKNEIDIIHIHDIQIAAAVFKANKKLHLPITLDLHENRPEIMKYYSHLNKFPGKQLISLDKWKAKEEVFVKRAENIVVVTNEAKAELVSRTGVNSNKIIALPNTVRKSFYEAALIDKTIIQHYEGKFVILYLGNTGLRRGLLTAIESIKELKDEIPNILLLIVGKSSEDKILKDKVFELGVEKYVDFQGWKKVSLFPTYITLSAICISPLHKNLHHDTTYANKVFQYMSFGKPLLLSDVLAQKNLINNVGCGLLHKDQNVKDFTVKILKLYGDKVLRRELGEKGKKFIAEKYSWEETSQALVNLYKRI